MNADTCGNSLFLDMDGKYCVSECETKLWMQDKTTNEKKCVETCPETIPAVKDD